MFDIKSIARLSRLTVAPEEEQQMAGQLTDILKYVETLQQADTSSVPGYGLSDAATAFRADEAREAGPVDERVNLSQATRRQMFLVPKVIGTGEA